MNSGMFPHGICSDLGVDGEGKQTHNMLNIGQLVVL